MERKRSYERDTLVLALPGMAMGKGHGRAQIEATRNGARPCPLFQSSLQQARGTKTGDWIGYRRWLTLKNPARHRNSQCRVCQMPDFHKSLPTPDPFLGRDYEGPVVKQP